MPKLISLKAHNQSRRESIQDPYLAGGVLENPMLNGIKCPCKKCSLELFDTAPNRIIIADPPKKRVHCKCGYRGFRLA